MNENINLVEILENCPKGTKLYSPLFGEVDFQKICNDDEGAIIITKGALTISFTKEGFYYADEDGECLLFPSKDQRDWSKFTAPWHKKLVELKESDDEKIRRWIIDDIRYNMNNEPLNNSEYKKKAEKAIAWLEKQGEQNLQSVNERAWLYLVSDVLTWKDGIGQYLDDPRVQELAKKLCSEYAQKLYSTPNTGKNERKFKIGDWVVNDYCIGRVVELTDDAYLLNTGQGIPFSYEHNAHLWTIQDANDGDVLATSKGVFIYNNTSILQAYCYYSNERNRFIIEDRGHHCPWNMQEVTPATKEQRDTLMKAMNDAGYEWDAEKKELKKLVVFCCKAPNRFDPKTLKEFDKVLVKEDGDCIWRVDIISVPDNYKDIIHYLIGNNDFDLIIPYNEDTKHLVGTAEEAPEFYRYWED